jgi:predicted signal transduction protein with EAL and GGDEF domain
VDACIHLCALALERELSRARIRQLAFYDGLTGLPNRSLLQAKADQAIASAAGNDEQLAVLFIDLDRFKQVNDSLGHPVGDELLRNVATRLQRVLRSCDIAGRLSGDEFVPVAAMRCGACCQYHRTPAGAAGEPWYCRHLAGHIRQRGHCNVSHGRQGYGDPAAPCRHGHVPGQEQGRGRFCFFSSEMNRLAQERLALETALRKALKSGGLRLHYQPQIEMATGRLYGVEAWRAGPRRAGRDFARPLHPAGRRVRADRRSGKLGTGRACRQLRGAKGRPRSVGQSRHRAFPIWICRA